MKKFRVQGYVEAIAAIDKIIMAPSKKVASFKAINEFYPDYGAFEVQDYELELEEVKGEN